MVRGMTVNGILLALVALLLATPAVAQSPDTSGEELGVFRDWKAYRFAHDGQRICFIYAEPTSTEPTNVRRGDIYMQVTHRPDTGIEDEVSYTTGYPFREESDAVVRIGQLRLGLFTQGENAWARTPDEDGRLVRAMIRGAQMEVRGTSARGTETVDTYSLSGFTAAYEEASRACGLDR